MPSKTFVLVLKKLPDHFKVGVKSTIKISELFYMKKIVASPKEAAKKVPPLLAGLLTCPLLEELLLQLP